MFYFLCRGSACTVLYCTAVPLHSHGSKGGERRGQSASRTNTCATNECLRSAECYCFSKQRQTWNREEKKASPTSTHEEVVRVSGRGIVATLLVQARVTSYDEVCRTWAYAVANHGASCVGAAGILPSSLDSLHAAINTCSLRAKFNHKILHGFTCEVMQTVYFSSILFPRRNTVRDQKRRDERLALRQERKCLDVRVVPHVGA